MKLAKGQKLSRWFKWSEEVWDKFQGAEEDSKMPPQWRYREGVSLARFMATTLIKAPFALVVNALVFTVAIASVTVLPVSMLGLLGYIRFIFDMIAFVSLLIMIVVVFEILPRYWQESRQRRRDQPDSAGYVVDGNVVIKKVAKKKARQDGQPNESRRPLWEKSLKQCVMSRDTLTFIIAGTMFISIVEGTYALGVWGHKVKVEETTCSVLSIDGSGQSVDMKVKCADGVGMISDPDFIAAYASKPGPFVCTLYNWNHISVCRMQEP